MKNKTVLFKNRICLIVDKINLTTLEKEEITIHKVLFKDFFIFILPDTDWRIIGWGNFSEKGKIIDPLIMLRDLKNQLKAVFYLHKKHKNLDD